MVTKGDADNYKEFSVAILSNLIAWRSPQRKEAGGVIEAAIMLVITSI